jgi:hypothetical protein
MKRAAREPRDGASKPPLTEAEMLTYLATLKREDWQPLFALIPLIQAKKRFGKWQAPGSKDGVIVLPHFAAGKTEHEFLKLVYLMRLVIAFDWGKWEQGRRLLKQDVSGLDLLTLLKLMTAIVRNDRFCEGALHSAFSNGIMLGILKAIRTRVEEAGDPAKKRK